MLILAYMHIDYYMIVYKCIYIEREREPLTSNKPSKHMYNY